jgi:hypothetical protein
MDFKTKWKNFWIGFRLADWTVAVFTMVLAVVAYFQMRDTHTLAEQAVIQSKAALQQATMSQQSFDAIFHPAVEVSLITFNQRVQPATNQRLQAVDGVLSYTLKNVGAAPAEQLRLQVKATVGGTVEDISPTNNPSELGVGSTFTDAPNVTRGEKTQEVLLDATQLKVRFAIQYATHNHLPVWQCSSFAFEPSKREMYQVADANADCGPR